MLGTTSYDVDTPEDTSGTSSRYLSKKDFRWIIGWILFIAIVLFPLWYMFAQQRDKKVCADNMLAVYKAMRLYAEEHDSRLPPLYEIGENGAPLLQDGKPLVWASQLVPYMSRRASFACPAAEDEEKMPAIGHDERGRSDILLTYGMYLPMGSYPYLLASSESTTALLLETSNNGALGSFNPVPFRDASGKVVPFDAFMAGFDDSNQALTPNSQWVTRLAFRGVAKGYKGADATPRHGVGIHIIYLDGHKGFLSASEAEVRNLGNDAEPPWRTR